MAGLTTIKSGGIGDDCDFDGEGTLVLDSTNNRVGIGTSSPGAKLEVKASSTPVIRLNQNDTYYAPIKLAGNDLEIRSSSGTIEFYNGADNGDSSTEKMRIDGSGRLLVGTTSSVDDTYKLQVVGTQSNGERRSMLLRYGQATGDGAQIKFQKNRSNTGGTTSTASGDDLGQFLYQGTDQGGSYRLAASIDCEVDATPANNTVPGRLVFYTTPVGTSQSRQERMRIDSSGRVGIGTGSDSVAALLEIGGIANSGTTEAFQIQRSDGVHLYGIQYDQGTNTIQIQGDNKNYAFQNKSSSGESMRIDSSGNVGIGTTSPDARLDISVTGAANGSTTDTLILNNDNSNTGDNLATRIRFSRSGNSSSNVYTALDSVRTGTHNTDFVVSVNDGGTLNEEFRVQSTGGISFNGDTATANALDDYEEGTWNPGIVGSAFGSVTYNVQNGRYTKIGNIVNFVVQLHIGVTSKAGSIVQIGSLPFLSTNTNLQGGAYIIYSLGLGTPNPVVYIGQNTSTINFYTDTGNSYIGTDVVGTSNVQIYLRGQYTTDL